MLEKEVKSPFNFNISITLTKTDGLGNWVWISFCATRELRTLDHQEKTTTSMNCAAFNTAAFSRGSQWFFHLGKKPLSETPAKPDILLWHGCEPWAAEKQTLRRSPSPFPPSPLSPRLFRRCRCTPADRSLISCTCQEGLSSKTAACVLLICWLRIMNFKWRLTV